MLRRPTELKFNFNSVDSFWILSFWILSQYEVSGKRKVSEQRWKDVDHPMSIGYYVIIDNQSSFQVNWLFRLSTSLSLQVVAVSVPGTIIFMGGFIKICFM